ncbi:DUF7264 domain-containing protein [Nocardia wallacei]|uniref:LtfC-like domain-containing protein n=1 Tax=Nocardia wallacei TaxID=480035 RepID=UPI0024565F84|nr:hypothetical protein [Nocardia wallacei]
MTIGNLPLTDTLIIVPGQDFVHDIDMPAGKTVPVGTTVELIVYSMNGTVLATWPANISSSAVSWDVDKSVTDELNTTGYFRIYVHYSDGTDLCWYRGQIGSK